MTVINKNENALNNGINNEILFNISMVYKSNTMVKCAEGAQFYFTSKLISFPIHLIELES